jgi:tRNA A-37 threonylcarbamoyl transferase component Bud32
LSLVGTQLGSYTLVSQLGEGGMGVVYVGENASLGRRVAIKVLHPEFASQPAIVNRFFNEARAANLIRHPSIVDIHDFGHAADGSAYIIMELLDGESLARRLHRDGTLPPAVAVRVVTRIASALGAAHTRGIIHRDLKPDNVILVPDPDHPGEERVKILDFGIAKLAEDGSRGGATKTGAVLGTPLYMSPEQADGARHVDPRADIYALGVVAYEMLCGRPPFVAEGYGHVMAMHLMQAPPPLRLFNAAVPERLEAAVLRALAKDPAQRYQSMEEMSAAMTAASSPGGASTGAEAQGRATAGAAAAGVAAARTGAPAARERGPGATGETLSASSALAMTHPTPAPPGARLRAEAAGGTGPAGAPFKRPSTLAASAAELEPVHRARARWIFPVAGALAVLLSAGLGTYLVLGPGTGPDGESDDVGGDGRARMPRPVHSTSKHDAAGTGLSATAAPKPDLPDPDDKHGTAAPASTAGPKTSTPESGRAGSAGAGTAKGAKKPRSGTAKPRAPKPSTAKPGKDDEALPIPP